MNLPTFELTPLAAAASPLLDILLRTSVQGGLVICIVWVVCRLVPRMPPGLRAGLWWLACLKLLVGFAWIEPVTLPLLPPPAPVSAMRDAPLTLLQEKENPATPSAAGAAAAPLDSPARLPSWPTGWLVVVIVGLWLSGVLARVARLARHRRQCRSLIARSAPVSDDVAAIFERLCAQVRPPRQPVLRLSSDVQVPQVLGARRPVILLPSDLRIRMSDEELAMVLCHELMHIARRDLWLGWIPGLAHDLLFFHPLAALAAREYCLAREAACDAAVIHRFHAELQAYGRLLVMVGVESRVAPLAATCSSASAQQLKRRLLMLQHLPKHSGRAWWWCVPVALLVGVLAPFQLIAQRSPVKTTVKESSTVTQGDDGNMYEPWVFLRSSDATSMNGTEEDVKRAKTFQRQPDDRLIWFKKSGDEYVIRDQAMLAAAEEAYRPLDRLGDEQGKLGDEQGQLGDRQGTLGARQGMHGNEQARLAGKQAEISARMAQGTAKQLRAAAYAIEHAGTAEAAALKREADRLVEELTREQEAISRQQEAIGRQQEALGQEQEALGRKQAELGQVQEELGRKQEEAAHRAQNVLIEIMKKAITSGLAQKVR
jgi:bla regulator protein blaR1